MNESILIIFNSNPYDGSDVTWNGLRLAEKLLDLQVEVKIFLMNDAVDLARDICKPPEGYYDLGKMLKGLIDMKVKVGVCGICKARCGLYKGEPYFWNSLESKMTDLAVWVKEVDKVISF